QKTISNRPAIMKYGTTTQSHHKPSPITIPHSVYAARRCHLLRSDNSRLYVNPNHAASKNARLPKKSVCVDPPVAYNSLRKIAFDPRASIPNTPNAKLPVYNKRVSKYMLIRKQVSKRIIPSRKVNTEEPKR